MNRESERKRLVELLYGSKLIHNALNNEGLAHHLIMNLATNLIDNGIVVPILKSGDRVYRVSKNKMWEVRIWKVEICGGVVSYIDNYDKSFLATHIGKGVFLTREEAEKMLKGEGK